MQTSGASRSKPLFLLSFLRKMMFRTFHTKTTIEFKERAREIMDLVQDHKAVAILRHKVPDAVLISASDYVEFVKLRRERCLCVFGIAA
jgi:hypothetical protein